MKPNQTALVATAGIVALAAIDLVASAGAVHGTDLLLVFVGALPVLVFGAIAMTPQTR